MTAHQPSLSVVAPCFNEEQVLTEFLRRASSACDATGLSYEIVLVDDGSRDHTWPFIARAAMSDARILGIRLRRNHGHQVALSAGIAACSGDLVLLIDADLQDPPELLPAMLEEMRRSSADVVYGQRRRRAGETLFKRATAAAFYRLIGWLAEVDIPPDTGDFRLITRDVAEVLRQMPEHHRFLRGMVAWVGGRQVPFLYDRDARPGGTSKFPVSRMLYFANDAITGFSRRPLQIATAAGCLSALLSFGLGVYSVLRWAAGFTVPGWTSLMAAITFLSMLQFFLLGIMGAYLGRLYEESRARPLFLEAGRAGQGLAATATPATPRALSPVLPLARRV